jgi:uncharacterized protein YidB (DUF937 family)
MFFVHGSGTVALHPHTWIGIIEVDNCRREISMGLLDGIVGNVMGSMLGGNQENNPLGRILAGVQGGNSAGQGLSLIQIVLSLMQQNGGLNGVLDKFRQGGMRQQADSWVSSGQNMGISPEQLQQVFGSSTIGNIAAQLGLSHEQAGSAMSQVLPEVVNQLTPEGQVPENQDQIISQGLESLSAGLPK